MVKRLLKLSALCLMILFTGQARADSFFVSENENIEDHIIPLIYVGNMEYYNRTETSAYTRQICEQLALEPKIIVTDDENLADYYIKPKLLQSKMEQINTENSRYSMSVALELWSKGGILINSEQQNRYIIIENSQNAQEIAQKLLTRLLKEAVNNMLLKIKNSELPIS